jgi:omega-6 fatty acid desaturase (delta-12 desaturase)
VNPPISDQPLDWQSLVKPYQKPCLGRGLWQLINSLGGYLLLWMLMAWSLSVSYWLSAALAVLAGGFLVRVFIIFHDCGHGSFLPSKLANDIIGFVTGVLTFTPYALWRKEHALHHSTAGDLDRRGIGDVPTFTVQEYRNASFLKRFGYRFIRNPWVLFGIGPLVMFLVKHRLVLSKRATPHERMSVHWTNLGILFLAIGMSAWMGFLPYLFLQLIAIGVAGSLGTWLFYVQHQFEGVRWERKDRWDYVEAALEGSSFYKLPKILQWFSGNIGFHHVHHLSPRIPNYHLEKCHNAESLFHDVPAVTLFESWKCLGFRLWDERHQRLVGFEKTSKTK